jgi:catechol-2,3-dioxygenase
MREDNQLLHTFSNTDPLLFRESIMTASSTSQRHTSVCGLGEIALRVNDLDTMQKFYEEVIRLQLMTRVSNCAFFRIADGYGGHTQVFALFDRSKSSGYRGTNAATSTIDHIAFEIPLSDFDNELERLRALGLEVEIAEHGWVHWRSLYVTDPEGNQVELACYGDSV